MFQKAKIVMYEDAESVKKVMDPFPIIKDLEMWADPSEEKFVNQHEKAIYNLKKWPQGMKEYPTEGFIKFERLRWWDCLFNSRFESGNLRQAFKVPVEADFEYIPVDEPVPDYLPEDI